MLPTAYGQTRHQARRGCPSRGLVSLGTTRASSSALITGRGHNRFDSTTNIVGGEDPSFSQYRQAQVIAALIYAHHYSRSPSSVLSRP